MLEDALATARGRLIVALDVETTAKAEAMVDRLGDAVDFYKIGLGLQLVGGGRLARLLKDSNKRVFLDYKYYDIPETVRNAVARAADLGVDFLTIHGVGAILRGAAEGRGSAPLKLFCVTVLTSLDAEDLRAMGAPPEATVGDLVLHRARQAAEAGIDGVIASPHEASAIKAGSSDRLLVVTPGIRLEGEAAQDQKRTATPQAAIRAGADYLVVGRPVTTAPDPAAAARAIVEAIASAHA